MTERQFCQPQAKDNPLFNISQLTKGITLWERFCLFFISKGICETDDFILMYKIFKGKMYILGEVKKHRGGYMERHSLIK